MARKLTIRLEPVDGTIERVYAFVDRKKRIADDGTRVRKWSGQVPDLVEIKLRVFGIGNATLRFGIDLPGTCNDQSLDLELDDGYGELELTV